jgi:leader peptidase (prepilin peptidase)/N-methyltransferase
MQSLAPWTWQLLAVVWGAIWGSFANVVIHRLPERKSVVRPSSHCPECSKPIQWFDNIPVASWLALRGRCRHCGWRIPARYPLVEAISASIALLVMREMLGRADAGLPLFLSGFLVEYAFLWALLVLSVIDLGTMLLPDAITLPGILVGLIYVFVVRRDDFLWNAVAVAGSYLVVLLFFVLLYKLIAKREGMGMGDAKLLGLIAALTGWKGAAFALVGGAVLGLLVNLPVLIMRGRGGGEEKDRVLRAQLPFGPMLSLAAFLYYFWGDRIVGAYYGLVDRIVLSMMG